MELDELDAPQSHMLGRIMAIEAALSTLITANPHSAEIAAAIRSDLQHVSTLGLFEPVQDDLLGGIQAGLGVLLKDI